jgi:hypothetical protein
MRLDTWNPGPSRRQMPRAALVSPLSMDNQVSPRIDLCPRVFISLFISMSILTYELPDPRQLPGCLVVGCTVC